MTGWEENNTVTEPTTENATEAQNVSPIHVLAFFRGALGLMIIVMNIAEIYCIRKWTGLKTVTRTMFINLSASDIVFGVALLLTPFFIFPQTDRICLIALPLNVISGVACSTSIMFLAFDIMAASWYLDSVDAQPFLPMPFIRTVTQLAWFLLLALGVWIAVEINRTACEDYFMFRLQSTGIAIYSVIVQALISFICYGVAFGITSHRIRKLKADLNSENLPQTSVVIKRLQRNMKLAKLAGSLGVLYLISHGPNVIIITAGRLSGVLISEVYIMPTSLLMPLNSLGNCVIYWWRSQEFRKIWKQTFSCILTNRVQPGSVRFESSAQTVNVVSFASTSRVQP